MATIIPTGVQTKFFAKVEGDFNTVTGFATSDAVPLNSLEITPNYEFHPSKEKVGTASLQNEIAGLKGGTWTASFYAKPDGATVTVEPDCSPFLIAAFGEADTSGDVSYRMHDGSSEITSTSSLQISRQAGANLYESIGGAWIEQLDIEIVGNAETVINVSGGFASYRWCYGAQVSGSHSTSDTTIQLNSGEGERIGVGARIQFSDGEDNGGHGYDVTAVDNTTDIVTVSPGLINGVADDVFVEALDKAQVFTSTANPIGGVGCGLSIGGVAVGLISFKASLKTGIHGLSAEASATGPTRLSRGAREISGEIASYFLTSETATSDISRIAGGAWNGTTTAIIARAGPDTTKQRMKVNVPAARINVSGVSLPESEEATITLTFTGRQASANGDELSVDFD
ncbi:hypothetical protein CMI37_06205 [Candidatus Pacearchaeota archaeon]|nr:hypothetical protein [Candidatus Pacearchaeota archaeon]|tara:strand:- start:1170 stop:2366 length:1197 start_codon:yes stop_codon:yes gene_type:complete